VVQQAIEDSGSEHVIAEDITPINKALVGCEDDTGSFIAPADEAEEQAGLLSGDGFCRRPVVPGR